MATSSTDCRPSSAARRKHNSQLITRRTRSIKEHRPSTVVTNIPTTSKFLTCTTSPGPFNRHPRQHVSCYFPASRPRTWFTYSCNSHPRTWKFIDFQGCLVRSFEDRTSNRIMLLFRRLKLVVMWEGVGSWRVGGKNSVCHFRYEQNATSTP